MSGNDGVYLKILVCCGLTSSFTVLIDATILFCLDLLRTVVPMYNESVIL